MFRTMRHLKAFPLTLALVLPSTLSAAEIVGQAVVNGKTVILFSDQTWSYEQSANEDCNLVSKSVQFCGEGLGWTKFDAPNPQVTAAYRRNDRQYGQFVIENLGTADGLTLDAMRGLVLEFAKQVSGDTPTIVATSDGEMNGQPTATIVYQLKIQGLEIVFANTLLLGDHLALQVQTYEISTKTFSDGHKKLHDEFVANTKVEAEDG